MLKNVNTTKRMRKHEKKISLKEKKRSFESLKYLNEGHQELIWYHFKFAEVSLTFFDYYKK